MAEAVYSQIIHLSIHNNIVTNKHSQIRQQLYNRPHFTSPNFLSYNNKNKNKNKNNKLQQQLRHGYAGGSSSRPPQQLSVLLEVEGKSAGDEEQMLTLFFNRIGWPSSLPTSEKGTFMKSVLREKRKALDDLVLPKNSALRPGVEELEKGDLICELFIQYGKLL